MIHCSFPLYFHQLNKTQICLFKWDILPESNFVLHKIKKKREKEKSSACIQARNHRAMCDLKFYNPHNAINTSLLPSRSQWKISLNICIWIQFPLHFSLCQCVSVYIYIQRDTCIYAKLCAFFQTNLSNFFTTIAWACDEVGNIVQELHTIFDVTITATIRWIYFFLYPWHSDTYSECLRQLDAIFHIFFYIYVSHILKICYHLMLTFTLTLVLLHTRCRCIY